MDPQDMLDVINENEHRLTPWEREFAESLTEQVDNGRTLSERQEEILEWIYDKVA